MLQRLTHQFEVAFLCLKIAISQNRDATVYGGMVTDSGGWLDSASLKRRGACIDACKPQPCQRMSSFDQHPKSKDR